MESIVDTELLLPPAVRQTPLLSLVWLKRSHRNNDAVDSVKKMLTHACGPYGRKAIIGGDIELAWGLLLPDNPSPLTSWSIYVNGRELCLIEGDFYDDPAGLKLKPGDNPLLAQRVAGHMRQDPHRRMEDLVGIYGAVYIDPDRSRAYVFGDLTGNRSVFWLADAERFMVTENLWAFRGCNGLDLRWDNMALMEMLTIGFPMAGRTWIAGVNQLQRGRQVCSHADGSTKVRMLLKPVVREPWSFNQSVRKLRASLDETTARICRRLGGPVGLALSGGLDSRLCLASLHSQGIEHQSFTFCGNPKAPDNQLAQAAARLVGEPHSTVKLNSGLAERLYQDLRIINEGESPAFAYFLLAASVQNYSKGLIIGHEEVRETASTFNPMSLKTRYDLARRMLRAYMTNFSGGQATAVIDTAYRASWQDVLDEWFDSFNQIDQPSIMEVFLEHVADYRVQRRTRPRIEAARWFCLPVYPYMDDRLYTTFRSLPLAHLHGERAPLAVLCDYKTGLENIPSAVLSFAGVSINKEYRYRKIRQLGSLVRNELVIPLSRMWQETKGSLGFGKSVLSRHTRQELNDAGRCSLFDQRELQKLLEKSERGEFVNTGALGHLRTVAVVDKFLFNTESCLHSYFQLVSPMRQVFFSNYGGASGEINA